MSQVDSGSAHPTLARADALRVVEMLAGLLNHVEARPRPDPDQYRLVIARLGAALDGLKMDARLRAILAACPSAAELYENLNYAHAGLCLHELDQSLATEQLARECLNRVQPG